MRLGTFLGEGGFGVRWSLFVVCPCEAASFRKTAVCCICMRTKPDHEVRVMAGEDFFASGKKSDLLPQGEVVLARATRWIKTCVTAPGIPYPRVQYSTAYSR